jgi:dihydroneopterin aldolase
MPDQILISQLELSSSVGVPEDERSLPQRLTASLVLEPRRGFDALEDRLENTVDYASLTRIVQQIARGRPRQLIETLAEEIAGQLLVRFPLAAVEVELRKYILPDTEYVAVKLRRERGG